MIALALLCGGWCSAHAESGLESGWSNPPVESRLRAYWWWLNGNVTPAAEFNIWADPDAAAEVFASGCEMVVFGLDATHQVRSTEERIAALEAIDNGPALTAAAMVRFSQRIERTIVGWDAAPLHDPCTVAWLLKPELFRLRPCHIEVETGSELTRGHTAVEFRVDPETARHLWAVEADAQGVFDLITGRLGAIR